MSLLNKIVEDEAESGDADRSVGNFEFHDDDEWNSWKMGPAHHEDEFEPVEPEDESTSESDETRSIMSARAAGRAATKPPSQSSRVGAPPKPRTKKPKAAGRKRKV